MCILGTEIQSHTILAIHKIKLFQNFPRGNTTTILDSSIGNNKSKHIMWLEIQKHTPQAFISSLHSNLGSSKTAIRPVHCKNVTFNLFQIIIVTFA